MGGRAKESSNGIRGTERVSISLPNDLNKDFETLRTKLGMSRSDAIRKAMRQFLDSQNLTLSKVGQNTRVLGIISYLEEAHVHAHPVEDASVPHEHDNLIHKHGDHSTLADNEDIKAKKYTPPASQIEFIRINEIQHEFLDCILFTNHIHTNINQCMIIVVVRGTYERITTLYKELSSFKTIRHIKLAIINDESGV